jgi:predicted transcriptional regulator of viral defense system
MTLPFRSLLLFLLLLVSIALLSIDLGMRQCERDMQAWRHEQAVKLREVREAQEVNGRRYDSLAGKMMKRGMIKAGEVF